MDGHEQAGSGDAVADGLKKGVVGPEDRGVLRDDVGKRGRNRRPRGKTMAILEQVAEYPLDPLGGRANVVGVEVGKVAAYLGPSLGLEVVEAVRPHPAQNRKGEEWPAGLTMVSQSAWMLATRGLTAALRGFHAPPPGAEERHGSWEQAPGPGRRSGAGSLPALE